MAALAPYLRDLGVSHVYLSPILRAMPGSPHGYDGIDPTRISDELGGEAGYYRMGEALRQQGIGQILDIVPNHLAASSLNPWWRDVLRHGKDSRYAHFFDLRWRDDGTIHLPVLGSDARTAVERGELRVESGEEGPVLRYFESEFSLATGSISEEPAAINDDTGKLLHLLDQQHFRLVDWHEAATIIDYRRFFDINGLVGVRVEEPDVFDFMHSRVLQLVRDGYVQGLRIDHIDGLRRPAAYVEKLRRAAPDLRIVVEKILETGETLPEGWPAEGTTGYDFLAVVNGLFVSPESEGRLTNLYSELTGESRDYDKILEESKRLAVESLFTGDVTCLAGQFASIHPRWPVDEVISALRETIVALPVYRTYLDPGQGVGGETDRARLHEALSIARGRAAADGALFDALEAALLDPATEEERAFLLAFQQYTGPAMAKGGEDTAFYRYNRLVSLNEVGASPGRWATSLDDFHVHCSRMAERWPRTMLTTTTHDTKRGEDVRLRIDALTEVPEAWSSLVRTWMQRHAPLRTNGPDDNDAYLLYQTLVGAWPLDVGRARQFMLKAVREAKTHTTWTNPSGQYEAALASYVTHVLSDENFIAECEAFAGRLARIALRSSLTQTLLKLTAPGVPDIYQGSELWELNLVDPDNRRPVDFGLRARLLEKARGLGAAEVLACTDEGLPKLWLIWKVLTLRREYPNLFEGSYTPLIAVGPSTDSVIAFLRNTGLIAVGLRLIGEDGGDGVHASIRLPEGTWRDVLTGAVWHRGELPVIELLRRFPVALLVRDAD